MGLKGKRLLILGGSSWKEAIKSFADEHGVVLIATGNDKSAGIFEIASESYTVNSTDAEAMKKLIKEKNIDGVYMGGSEAVISAACEYLNDLGMPCYCNKAQWDAIQNKGNLKKLFSEFNIPTVPRYEYSYEQLDKETCEINFPVITKPADGCGSTGFSVCHNIEELKKGYKIASENSASGDVIIERFVKNQGVVVFYTFTDGKMVFSGMEDKYPLKYSKDGSYVAGMLVFESRFEEEFRSRFDSKLEKMFASLGIKEGTIWIEVFHDGEDYWFNEAGYRYGGSVTVYPIDYLLGINQVASDMYYALTGESKIYGHQSLIRNDLLRKKNYCMYPIYLNAGEIASVKGFDDVNKMDTVVRTIITKGVGDTVKPTGNFSQNMGFIHFVFAQEEEFKSTISKINEKIEVLDTDGKEMRIKNNSEFINNIVISA